MQWQRSVVGTAVAGVVVLLAGLGAALGWLNWVQIAHWAGSHAGWLVVFGLAGALLTTAGIRAVRSAQQTSRRTGPAALSWWAVVAAAAVVTAVTWAATAWLLHEANQATDPPTARVEAIKTGLSIGAGTGGIFALLLAVRRQWHQELDASEKQVTELYTKASDQLGSDKAAVRLAGLYALERVAQNYPTQRQTIVNVLCAYLRMPYQPPHEPSDHNTAPEKQEEYRERVQEREVRLTAQRLLILWTAINLDLSGAVLINLDLGNCKLRQADFHNAHFIGPTRFDGARFTGAAQFDGAIFTGTARFDRAQFASEAGFGGTQFASDAGFGTVKFTGNARFDGAIFTGTARFDRAQFTGDARFDGAKFTGDALFTGATSIVKIVVDQAQFTHGLPELPAVIPSVSAHVTDLVS
jgi:hypothetical protein